LLADGSEAEAEGPLEGDADVGAFEGLSDEDEEAGPRSTWSSARGKREGVSDDEGGGAGVVGGGATGGWWWREKLVVLDRWE
jgi:hypothetical protein